jgi:hypothetical protein
MYHLLDLSSSLSISDISYDFGLFNTCKCFCFLSELGNFLLWAIIMMFFVHIVVSNPKSFWSIGEGSIGRTFRFLAPPLRLPTWG